MTVLRNVGQKSFLLSCPLLWQLLSSPLYVCVCVWLSIFLSHCLFSTPERQKCTRWAMAQDSTLRSYVPHCPRSCWINNNTHLEDCDVLGQSWERKVAYDPCLDQGDEPLHPPSPPTLGKPVIIWATFKNWCQKIRFLRHLLIFPKMGILFSNFIVLRPTTL